MYQFIKDDIVIGTKATPNWIFLQKNGFYGLCDYEKCEGVAIDGVPYHLDGREGLADLETVSFEIITEEEFAQQILNEAATEEQIRIAIEEGVNSIDS